MSTGRLWHTIRNPNGSWQSFFGLIESQEQNNPGAFTDISCAGVGNECQVVGIVGGRLWHTIRHASGTWQNAFGLIESQEQNNPGAFADVRCAGVGNELQVVGAVGGQLWHTIRHANGTWQNAFGLIESQEQNNPGAFADVSCAGVANELHVVGVVGGKLWHTIRHASGTWQNAFGLIEAQEQNNPGAFTDVSCAGVGNELHVVGVVGGMLWHTIRHASGTWQNAFGLIEAQEQNNPGAFADVSCAGVANQLQVAGVVSGQLWHTIRNTTGTWQNSFGLIEAQEQNNPGAFADVSCAGVGTQLQIVGIA
jgi:ribosomal protein S27E